MVYKKYEKEREIERTETVDDEKIDELKREREGEREKF